MSPRRRGWEAAVRRGVWGGSPIQKKNTPRKKTKFKLRGVMFIAQVIQGVISTLTVASSPLYRYPYRSAEEAFRGDAKKITGDIEHAISNITGRGVVSEHDESR
jgi:hypothetical protein